MTQTKEKVSTFQRVKCEIWSRVVGYLRPINGWNKGKQAEYKDRKTYSTDLTK